MKKKIAFWFIVWVVIYFMVVIGLRSESVLKILGRFYFNNEYYMSHYPEVKNFKMSPYNHYINQGWKLGYNPNDKFDTKFYEYYYKNINKYKLTPLSLYTRRTILRDHNFSNKNDVLKAITLKNPKYYLSLVALFQNEARFLKEWIEFYRMMGVEHFYLYNHRSKDDYMSILKPYIDQGIVELNQIYEKPIDTLQFYQMQIAVYNKKIKDVANQTEWLMIIDSDEFIYPKNDTTLKDALKKYDECAALSIPWVIFGTNGVMQIDRDDLMIEKLVTATDQIDGQVKTIIKPRYVANYPGQHYPNLIDGYGQCDEEHDYFYGHYLRKNISNMFGFNHYWTRDYEFFEKNKLARLHVKGIIDDRGFLSKILNLDKIFSQFNIVSPDEMEKISQQEMLNQKKYEETQLRKVKDLSIQRFVPEMKKRMKMRDSNSN